MASRSREWELGTSEPQLRGILPTTLDELGSGLSPKLPRQEPRPSNTLISALISVSSGVHGDF